jgi:pimeloyl-ACP methyl ester carboxylesterase
LANSGEGWKPSAIECRVHILGGEADYMAGPQVVEAWAKQVKNGSSSLMPRIGHWGGLEAPGQVAAELAKFLEGKS